MFKKILAFFLAVIMLVGLFPAVVFADNPDHTAGDRPVRQRPITQSRIVVDDAASGGASYSFNIMWARPGRDAPLTTFPATRLWEVPVPAYWTLFPVEYIVNFRSATRNELPTWQPITVPAPANQQSRTHTPTIMDVSTGTRAFAMQPASLYDITITPRTRVPVLLPVPPGSPAGTPQPIGTDFAPMDTGPPHGRDLLFLTDITPTAVGGGGELTVTWENPVFIPQGGGAPITVFPYWQISYAFYEPSSPGEPAWITRPPMSIGPGDGQITLDGTQLTATIEVPLQIARSYIVRVEPMLGPNPANVNHRVRVGREYARVDSIPGRNFDLFFTRNDYSAVFTTFPILTVTQEDAEFIRLQWTDLTGIMSRLLPSPPGRLVIEEWPAEMRGIRPLTDAGRMRIISELTGFHLNTNVYFVGPGIPREERGFALAIHLADGEIIRTPIEIFPPPGAVFGPYSPEVVDLHHVGGGRLFMEWLAFARFPATPAEFYLIPPDNRYRGRFRDTALYYEIFVSDSWTTLQTITTPLLTRTPAQLIESDRPSPIQPEPYPVAMDPTWQYRYITQFQRLNAQGGLEVQDIQGNRVYFVRIRVIRDPGGQYSEAFGSVYVPPLVPLRVTPEMIASPPVEIVAERELQIDIQWDTRYLEIMRPNPQDANFPDRNVWYTVVGVNIDARNNNLIFGRSAAQINFQRDYPMPPGSPDRHMFLNQMIAPSNLRNRLLGLGGVPVNIRQPASVGPFLTEARGEIEGFLNSRWGLPLPPTPPITLRIQDTTIFNPGDNSYIPFRYEILAVPYATVMAGAGGVQGFDAFMRFANAPANQASWTSIGQPYISNGVARETVTLTNRNTSYVIFIRPYVHIAGQGILRAAYPSFVIGTTIDVPDRPAPYPTTPVLFEVPRYTTRNRVAVRWRVQDSMIYTLFISDMFTDYPDRGTPIPLTWQNIQDALAGRTVELENPRAVLDVQNVNGVPYFHLRISGRFPDTQYYIWAIAFGVDEYGNVGQGPSAPSNPVDIRTLDIEPPPPPRSFSRAPQNLLNLFNRYNGTTYRNDEPYSLVLSWMRVFSDMRDYYGNLRPRAEAGEGAGSVKPLNLPNLGVTEAYVALHLLRFDDLVANRRYYARARTILTVQRGGPDIYSYEVHLADNEDFLDATVFIIPPLIAMDPRNTRRAYSEWVYLEVDTGYSDDEYDGVHRPDQYPLPERDWEITYDPTTQTLTWRFRTTYRGADGRLDQNVDQRFISRLIADRVFTFTVDMTTYRGVNVHNREIILPESILRAFDERQITLEILTYEKNIRIPPGAFNTAQVRDMQMGIGSYYRIRLDTTLDGMPPILTNTEFATVPLRFSVSANTATRHANLNTFARPITVVLPVEGFYEPEGLRTGLFIVDPNTATWRDTDGDYDFVQSALSSTIQRPSTFAGIIRHAPPTTAPHPSNDAMNRVTSRLVITDMLAFDPAHEVTANEFNNIVNAISNNRTNVTISATIPAANVQSMTRARMLAQPNFTREQAIDILVRLYEFQTRQIITPQSTAQSIPGMQNATPALHRNLRVAADIGFITGPLEPHGRLTMGELMHMIDIIILDAGI